MGKLFLSCRACPILLSVIEIVNVILPEDEPSIQRREYRVLSFLASFSFCWQSFTKVSGSTSVAIANATIEAKTALQKALSQSFAELVFSKAGNLIATSLVASISIDWRARPTMVETASFRAQKNDFLSLITSSSAYSATSDENFQLNESQRLERTNSQISSSCKPLTHYSTLFR